MLAEKELKMTTTCNIKKTDSQKFRNREGNVNLVARFRRTRKGQKLNVGHGNWGVDGKDGSDYYSIQIGADGVLYCNCPDYKIRGHKSNRVNPGTNYMCKHVRAYLVVASKMISEGVSMNSEAIIYNAQVTEAAIELLGNEAARGQKVGSRKVA